MSVWNPSLSVELQGLRAKNISSTKICQNMTDYKFTWKVLNICIVNGVLPVWCDVVQNWFVVFPNGMNQSYTLKLKFLLNYFNGHDKVSNRTEIPPNQSNTMCSNLFTYKHHVNVYCTYKMVQIMCAFIRIKKVNILLFFPLWANKVTINCWHLSWQNQCE